MEPMAVEPVAVSVLASRTLSCFIYLCYPASVGVCPSIEGGCVGKCGEMWVRHTVGVVLIVLLDTCCHHEKATCLVVATNSLDGIRW